MAAKRQPKKSTAAKAGNQGDPKLTIQRGDTTLALEELPDLMAVKKRPRSGAGSLAMARKRPDEFEGLAFVEPCGAAGVEIYRIDAAVRDDAMSALRNEARDIAWCAHVYRVAGSGDSEGGWMIPTDVLFIELAPEASEDQVNAALDEHGLEVQFDGTMAEDARSFLVRLTGDSTENPIKIARKLIDSGLARTAEPDFAVRGQLLAYRPSDPLFSSQWHLENPGGIGLTPGADVSAPDAWDVTRGDRRVVVAILDDSVQIDHPDFSSPGKIVAPIDFGEGDDNPSPVASTDNHGTACAGVAVADENGNGVVGIAPNCRLMPIRWSRWITDQSIEQWFGHARDHGADVINCSWGVGTEFYALSTRQFNAIRSAATTGRGGLGCVIVFAAGNEDSPVNGTQGGVNYRSGFAIHPDVIAVAASNSRDLRSHYSNFGAEISVCAPSSGAGGRGVVTTDRTGSPGYAAGDHTTQFGGTSSAAPLVAGIAALILSVDPTLRAQQVKDVLQRTAEKIDPANGGYDQNGHSALYGFGRVNAARALAEVRGDVRPPWLRDLEFRRTPSRSIPDRDPQGIRDAVEVQSPDAVHDLEVSVDIVHSFRGDLTVDLIGPDGRSARLHDRSGGGADDLIVTYRVADAADLSSFVGTPAAGTWTLLVADHASLDIGTLRAWTLRLRTATDRWTTSPGLKIPDNQPSGVSSELLVDGQGTLRDLTVDVDINHSWRGDLLVTLQTPNGRSANLHEGVFSDSADNVRRAFSPADTPSLQAFLDTSTPIHGTWRLHVVDRAAADVGKLNEWGLRLST